MELTIARAPLSAALSTASGVANKKSPDPVVANVLLRATAKDRLLVAATDRTIYFETSLPCEAAGDFAMVVDARSLAEIVASIAAESIKFKLDGTGKAEIKSGKTRFEIAGLPPRDFPRLPDTSKLEWAEVSGPVFRTMIERVLFACDPTVASASLQGVHIDLWRGLAMASDSHVGVIARGELCAGPVALIPKAALIHVCKAFASADKLTVAVAGMEVFFRAEGSTIGARLLDSSFNAQLLEDVASAAPKHVAVCPREALIGALKRVSLVTSRDLGRDVELLISEGSLRLVGKGTGAAEDELEVSYSGKGVELRISSALLLYALETIETDEASIGVVQPLDPVWVRPVGNKEHEIFVMPMRRT